VNTDEFTRLRGKPKRREAEAEGSRGGGKPKRREAEAEGSRSGGKPKRRETRFARVSHLTPHTSHLKPET